MIKKCDVTVLSRCSPMFKPKQDDEAERQTVAPVSSPVAAGKRCEISTCCPIQSETSRWKLKASVDDNDATDWLPKAARRRRNHCRSSRYLPKANDLRGYESRIGPVIPPFYMSTVFLMPWFPTCMTLYVISNTRVLMLHHNSLVHIISTPLTSAPVLNLFSTPFYSPLHSV